MVFAGGDLFHGAAGDDGVGFGVGDGGVGGRALEVVVLLDEEPVGLGLVEPPELAVHADERPLALHLGAVEDELERAVAQAGVDVGVGGLRLPGALVPEHDGAAAVLALGDDAFEAAVLHGVVFDLDGEALVRDDVAGALGDGPGLEDAVPAEAEVVVEVRGGVLLDAEGELRAVGSSCDFAAAAGFGGDVEVAHGAVARELLVDGVGGGVGGFCVGGCGFRGLLGAVFAAFFAAFFCCAAAIGSLQLDCQMRFDGELGNVRRTCAWMRPWRPLRWLCGGFAADLTSVGPAFSSCSGKSGCCAARLLLGGGWRGLGAAATLLRRASMRLMTLPRGGCGGLRPWGWARA